MRKNRLKLAVPDQIPDPNGEWVKRVLTIFQRLAHPKSSDHPWRHACPEESMIWLRWAAAGIDADQEMARQFYRDWGWWFFPLERFKDVCAFEFPYTLILEWFNNYPGLVIDQR